MLCTNDHTGHRQGELDKLNEIVESATGNNEVLSKNVLYLAKTRRSDLVWHIKEEVEKTAVRPVCAKGCSAAWVQVKQLCSNKYSGDEAERLRQVCCKH